MTSLADQSVEQLGGRWSILTRQKLDQVGPEGMLQRLSVSWEPVRRTAPTRTHPIVSASHGLGKLAQHFERLPPLRRGEHHDTHLPADAR